MTYNVIDLLCIITVVLLKPLKLFQKGDKLYKKISEKIEGRYLRTNAKEKKKE